MRRSAGACCPAPDCAASVPPGRHRSCMQMSVVCKGGESKSALRSLRAQGRLPHIALDMTHADLGDSVSAASSCLSELFGAEAIRRPTAGAAGSGSYSCRNGGTAEM